MRIAVISVCQAPGIGDALVHLLDGATVLALEAPAVRNANALDAAEQALDGCDAVFAHFLPDEFGPLSTTALRARFPNLVMMPGLSFTGFHPDCTYLAWQQNHYTSPLGPYNSAIVAAAFSLGLPVERAVGLFNAFVFRKLGYYDEFPKAEAFFRRATADMGIDIAREWPLWMAKGAFMNTINHPRPNLLAGIAKLVAIKAGLIPEYTPTPEIYFDGLSGHAIWPVYPELAREIGVPGGYVFKRPGWPDGVTGRSVHMVLRDFVAESYAMYAGYPREMFDIEEVARPRTTIGALIS